MGMCGSKQEPEEYPMATDSSNFDKWEKFEHTLPFYRTRVDIFEGRVKRFVLERSSVTLKQLRYAFKHDHKWDDI